MKKRILTIFILILIMINGCNNNSDYFVNTEGVTSSSQEQIQETEALLTIEDAILNYIIMLYEDRMSRVAGNQLYAKYIMLMSIDNEEEIVCYLMPWCIKFNVKSDGEIKVTGVNGIVCEITLKLIEDESYTVTSYWEPGDIVSVTNDFLPSCI